MPTTRDLLPPLAGLSAVIPVHDEEANLLPMGEAVLAVLPRVATRWELVVVDDGSRDATPAVAEALAARCRAVRVVRHPVRRGYGAALRSGLAAARHDVVFLTDGDRQFDPAELARLVPALADADAVIGYRRARADPRGRRLAGSAWTRLVGLLLGVRVRDVNCAFKLIRRSALEGVTLEAAGAAVSAELLVGLARRGRRIVEVPVAHFPRPAGRPSGGDLRVAARAALELLRLVRRTRHAALVESHVRADVGSALAADTD
ncbi:MAG TPA: glycosyltransferase family 2 protein [Candidatus Binatia bacterium]|nr:glycosyltransferase family 2 protein [Candidatus Binatia bacterium]